MCVSFLSSSFFFWLLLMLLLLWAHDSERHGWTPVPRSSAVKVHRSACAALKLKSENKQTRGGKKKKGRKEVGKEESWRHTFSKKILWLVSAVSGMKQMQGMCNVFFFVDVVVVLFLFKFVIFLMTMWKSNDDDFCLMLPIDWSLKKTQSEMPNSDGIFFFFFEGGVAIRSESTWDSAMRVYSFDVRWAYPPSTPHHP